MKRVLSFVFVVVLIISCMPFGAMAYSSEIGTLTYTDQSGTSRTANPSVLGETKYAQGNLEFDATVYLAELPFGATVTGYTKTAGSNMAQVIHTSMAASTNATTFAAALAASESYLNGTDLPSGEGLTSNAQYKTQIVPVLNTEEIRNGIPQENVKGFAIKELTMTAKTAAVLIVVIPTTPVSEIGNIAIGDLNYLDADNMTQKAVFSVLGETKYAQGNLEFDATVYLAELPSGATVTGYSKTAESNMAQVIHSSMAASTNATAFAAALTASESYLNGTDLPSGEGLTSNAQYKTQIVPVLNTEEIRNGIPQENVKGFAIKELTMTAKTAAVLIVTIENSSINRDNLDAEIAKVWNVENNTYTNNYYTEFDRWTGANVYPKDENNPERGFFWDATQKDGNPLTAALAEFTSQTAVNAAKDALAEAIAKLIPSDQANTTLLYEAIQAFKSLSNDGNYSEASWNNFENARDAAETLMAKMFDANGNPLSDNNPNSNEAINAAAAALTQAYEDLLYADLANEIPVWKRVETWLLSQTGLNAGDYSNWSTWADAYDTLDAMRGMKITTDSDYKTWTRAIIDAAKAYARLEDAKAVISVHVRVADNFGALYPEYALSNAAAASYDGTKELDGSHSIDGLLAAIGYDNVALSPIPYTDSTAVGQHPCVMVYINGTLAVYRDDITVEYWRGELFNGTSKNPEIADIQLHDGDDVVIVRAQTPYYTYYVDTIPDAPYMSYCNSASLLDIQNNSGVIEVEAGSEFSLSVIKKDAAPENAKYGSPAKPAYGVSFFLSDLQTNEDTAHGAIANTPTEAVTDGSGSGSLTIYAEGWYKLFVADVRNAVAASSSQGSSISEGTYPNLAGGDYILVHVVKSENDLAVRDELQAELDEVYYAYGQDFYTAEQWETVTVAYQTASEMIRNSELLGDAYDSQKNAIETIKALQEMISEQNDLAYRRMSSLLTLLPTESEISVGLFTQGDASRMNETLAHYATLTEYQRTMLTAAQSTQWTALQKAWGNDGSKLPSAGQISFTIEVKGGFGAQLDSSINSFSTVMYTYFQENDTYYPAATSHSIDSLAEPTSFAIDAPIEAWGLSVIFNESPDFEVYKLGYEGVDEEKVAYTTDITEGQHSIYISYTDAFKNEITKPAFRRNVKITIYTRSTGDLESLREAAIEELTVALNGYSKSDYEAAKWTELNKAYNVGVAAISTATSESEITEAKAVALAAMAAVEKKSSGDLGTVSVIVENTTYGDADFNGAFVKKTIPLTTDSTMMKSILSALSEAGYAWVGTGGIGYDITYLSSIYIDANGNGKPDNDEKSLAEFDGGPQSGWMGTLNDWFVNEGLNMFTVANGKLKDGDVIRAQYTVAGYGTDLGATWANNDTSLKDLTVDGGSLGTEFDSSVLEYVLTPTGGSISLLPTAANKNFQVRIFLNQQNKSAVADYYRSSESIPVKSGDVIWIGVGENAWGTMNEGTIVATWYKINVVSKDDANAVVKLINAIGSVTYSNHKDKQAAVGLARAAYEALTDTAKANVDNYATLTAAEEAIAGYEAVDALKAEIAALPGSVTLTDRDAVETAKAHYDALTAAQKNLLTVAETNKLLKAVNTLTLIDELKAIDKTPDFVSTEANTETDVMAALRTWLQGKTSAKDEDVIISITGFTDANSSRDGSYTATVSFTLRSNGSQAAAATQEKTISGTIKRSSNAGIKSITVKDVPPAEVSGTAYKFTLPYGTDLATVKAEQFAIGCEYGANVTTVPESVDGGKTWTFTVTAEDGTKKDYTVTLSVSNVKVTVLDSWVYYVSDDVEPVKLDASAVSGLLQVVNTDALLLDEGTEEAFLWVEARQKSNDVFTITPVYAPVGKKGKADPADYLKETYILTLPVPGTEYAKVLFDGKYLDAAGSDSGITFAARAGDYTLIPDAHIAIVTFHEFDGVSDRQIVFYRGDAGKALPEASKSGAAFKGWYAKADCTGDKYTTVSDTLPTDLYPLWSYGVKTEEVGDIEDRVEVSAIVQGDVATITVESKKPCAVIVEKPDGSFERLEAFDNGDGSCCFVQEDYDADMVFYVAALGDYDENGVLEPADLTAANLTIIGDMDLEPLSAFIMGAKDGKLRTVDLAKLFLHIARNDVEW